MPSSRPSTVTGTEARLRADAEAEQDRLRAVVEAARTLVEELDSNPIGEYGDAVCEAIDQLDAKLKIVAGKEGT